MKKLEKITKKAGFGGLFVAGAFALGVIISPQIENYKTLSNKLNLMSAKEKQYTVNKKMADFKMGTFYEKMQNIGERIALDAYYPRRKSFQ